MENFTKEELEEALRTTVLITSRCEKVQPKLEPDISQCTPLIRRIKALRIAPSLIIRELRSIP